MKDLIILSTCLIVMSVIWVNVFGFEPGERWIPFVVSGFWGFVGYSFVKLSSICLKER